MNYNSPKEIKEVLNTEGIGLKKRWGQNFLINQRVREKIIDILCLNQEKKKKEKEIIWEIGPGLGAMTELILKHTDRLVVFEIDRGFIRYIKKHLMPSDGRLKIVAGDLLKTWKQEVKDGGVPDKIIGNLPYNSASAFIVSIIEGDCIPKKMVFTVQKELACRMVAHPRCKNYSSFSINCQFGCDIRLICDLKPGSFYPRPNVVSTVIEMIPRKNIRQPVNRKLFFLLIQALFEFRRKTLRNNILSGSRFKAFNRELVLQAGEEEGFDLSRRSEEYGVDDFIRFSNRVSHMCGIM